MGLHDRLSEQHLKHVLASIEAADLVPPDDLLGRARSMFEDIAKNNRARPWNTAHAFALADYCRVCVMWEEQMKLIASEGVLNAKGRTNERFNVARLLSADRLRLGKLLGLHTGANDRYLGGEGKLEETAREIGANLARSQEAPDGDLLA